MKFLTNLFNNKTVETKSSIFDSEKQEDQLVLQIHNEVDSLEEQSIQAVNDLLNSINIPTSTQVTDKAALMKSLGFSANNETVVQGEKIKQEIKDSTELKELTNKKLQLINDYRLVYPLDKIIPMSEFQKVLTKYNLIYAPSNSYIKDVPEKNLIEIKQSKATNSNHKASEFQVLTNIVLSRSATDLFRSRLEKLDLSRIILNQVLKQFTEYEVVRREDYDEYMREQHNHFPKEGATSSIRTKYIYTSWVSSEDRYSNYYSQNFKPTGLTKETKRLVYNDEYANKHTIVNALVKLLPYSASEISSNISNYKTTSVKRDSLFIAAPKTHFNLDNLTTSDGKEFYLKQKVQITQLKDPIAFHILKGVDKTSEEFVRIISKWGTSDDQSYLDPIVQDEKQN